MFILLSRDSGFLWRLLPLLRGSQRVIVTVEFPWRAASCSMIQRAAAVGQVLSSKFDLQALVVAQTLPWGEPQMVDTSLASGATSVQLPL
jgi:hypothetical protein